LTVTEVVFVIFVFLLLPLFGIVLDTFLSLIFLLLPVMIGGVTYLVNLQMPGSKAKARAKRIDAHLPYAVNFISAMAAAGITPTEIFHSLSKQDMYGEIKEEASWVYRDVAMLGTDIITSIKANIKRTPSTKFKEFLQGTVVTVTSGGSLKSYFMAKADQYMRENRQAQKQAMESLGIMAESYVTAAVAGILLIMIVIPLMMMISGDASQISFLYIIVFFVVPLIHTGFAIVIKGMVTGGT
jgi:flagellar protein FlaJ